jgi:hypothetical protein
LVAVLVMCAGCDWLSWAAGPGHTGANSFEGGFTKTTAPTFAPSAFTDTPTTGQVVVVGRLVLVQRDGSLTAYDAQTYGVVWVGALPPGSTLGGTPAVDAGSRTVFVVVAQTANPVLVGFDLDGSRNCNVFLHSCDPIFRAALGNTAAPASPPAVEGGKVFANGASALYAFDAAAQMNCVSVQVTRQCTPLWTATTDTTSPGVGPALAHGVVYEAVSGNGGVPMLGAFNAGTGAALWAGTLDDAMSATPSVANGRVFAPAGAAIAVFTASGCGESTCPSSYAFQRSLTDVAGDFLSTPALDGTTVFATNGNGSLYEWSQSGCDAATCEPAQSAVVNAPTVASPGYSQMPAVVSGMVLGAGQRVIAGENHVVAYALDEPTLQEVTTWDLGAGHYGDGLASVSEAGGVVYMPTDGGVTALHTPPLQPLASLTVTPLTLSPAFSPSTFDYTVACATGSNTLTFTMSAEAGGSVQLIAPTTTGPSASQEVTVSLAENQGAVVRAANSAGRRRDYWVRCLPHDFPAITVAHPSPSGPSPGWYVLGDNFVPSGRASFAMILDTNGTPVWYRRSTPGPASNVTPLGHDTVAFMQNLQFGGFTTDPNGHYDVYDLDSNTTSEVRAVGVPADQHELSTTRNGNFLLLSYALKDGVDLTGLSGNPTPGPNSTIADCVVQEVDPGGNLVWQWTGSDHIDPVTETTMSPVPTSTVNGKTVYDVFHCNSIDADASGNVLVSARHTNAIYDIRRSDGTVVWKMGGKPSNKDGASIITVQNDPYGSFVQQHDARFLPNGDVSVFDNQNAQTGRAARGVEYSIDFTTNTAQPVYSFATPTGVPSCCTGNFRRMSDGHTVVDWGYLLTPSLGGPVFAELDSAGNDVFEVSFEARGASYRTAKAPSTEFNINVLRATAGQ